MSSNQESQQAPSSSLVAAAFKALRPKQWVKNILLFAALIFSLNFDDGEMWVRTIGAFFAFCFVSSTGYIFNDLRDREADRLHPKKCRRPIAAGLISVSKLDTDGVCVLTAVASPPVSLPADGLPWFLSSQCCISYHHVYSMFFKNVVILDVMFIMTGFVWRAAAGAVAIQVHISAWLLVCSLLVLFWGSTSAEANWLS